MQYDQAVDQTMHIYMQFSKLAQFQLTTASVIQPPGGV